MVKNLEFDISNIIKMEVIQLLEQISFNNK
jgi:hypothetical protein